MIVGSAIDTHDGDEHDKNINKIIKNVARKVVLDKVNDT